MKRTGTGLRILMLTFLATIMLTASAFATSAPSYRVVGSYNEGTKVFKAEFYVSGVEFCAGRVALDYDESKLSLINSDNYFRAIKAPSGIMTTTEGLNAGQLISTEEGFLMFAFYPDGGVVDATSKEVLVATVEFALQAGASVADFDRSTLQMRYIRGNLPSWDTGAGICDSQRKWYKNGVAYTDDCGLSFSYTGSEKAAANEHEIELKISDSSQIALNANVILQNEALTADASGIVRFNRRDGSYTYKINMDGYGERIGVITVAGNDISKKIVLEGNRELVKEARDKLAIIYKNGESATNVISPIGLVTTGLYNCKIVWTSSNPRVLTTDGGVFPASQPTAVTLTAVVSKDGQSEKATFEVIVAAKGTIPPTLPPTTSPGEKFEDLGSVPWAAEAIIELANAGIIEGMSETSYAPKAEIKRGDFLVLLMRMLKPEATLGEGFVDVPQTSYYYREITLAKSLGIAEGMEGNRFDPQGKISRQDMMVLTFRALRVLGYMQADDAAYEALEDFTDNGSIAAYAREAMANLVKSGYISGNGNNTLTPLNLTNRAEAAVFLHRIYLNMA